MEDAAFLRSHHGYEEGWVGRRIVGTGEEGRAGLWDKMDDAGTVIDVSTRVKDCNVHSLCLIPTIPVSKSASSRRETSMTINCENHLKRWLWKISETGRTTVQSVSSGIEDIQRLWHTASTWNIAGIAIWRV